MIEIRDKLLKTEGQTESYKKDNIRFKNGNRKKLIAKMKEEKKA